MRMRLFGIALGFLLVPAVASADIHRWGFFAAGSYAKASNLFGFQTSAEMGIGDAFQLGGWLAHVVAIGDFSVHAGEHNGANLTLKTLQGGAGWRKARSAQSKHVFGFQGVYGSLLGDNGRFTQTYGGLYEFAPHRVNQGWETSFRVQYDVVFPNGDDNNFQRFSFGGVIRFKQNP